MNELRYGSVCSGIEAASIAWEPLGFKPAWFSEIDPFPSAVLAHHWPDVANLGDMTTISQKIRAKEVEAPDILVGGTPCQAFSVAGLRGGLSDARGQLTISFVELADAIDDVRSRDGKEAAIIVWENVPGVLNTKDNAFGCFLGALSGEDEALLPAGKKWTNVGCVFGHKRTISWIVKDAQYFGVAQRRRRVFVVASARKDIDTTKILFEFEGVRRDIAPSRETRENTTATVVQSLASGKSATGTLMANAGTKLWLGNQEAFTGDYHIVVSNSCEQYAPEISRTLLSKDNDSMAYDLDTYIAFSSKDFKVKDCNENSDISPAIVYGIPGNWIGRAPENGGNAVEPMVNVSPCLTSTDRHGVVYALAGNTINHSSDSGGNGNGYKEEISYTLVCNNKQSVVSGLAVRRLLPIECERLQGFPDHHTLIPTLKMKRIEADELLYIKLHFPDMSEENARYLAADGPRYKALGNSMATTVMAWLGKRIKALLDDAGTQFKLDNKTILDMCCGSRMFWFNRENPRVLFCDIRKESHILCDGRRLEINPDMIADFRSLPFPDESFNMVVFDPPHLKQAGKNGWQCKKYGVLNKDTWRDDLTKGFKEAFRVLKPLGTLIFKWNEIQIKTSEILALTEHAPAFGHPSGKRSDTHWICFVKDGVKQ